MMRELKLYESGIRDYNKLLEGRKAFVTTAARGIGKSIALLFARQGAAVYFGGRNEEYVLRTERELGQIMPECRGYIIDLANAAQSEDAAQAVLRDSGGIDILVCTAGVNCHCAADAYRDEDMARLLETNYLSGLRFARAFLPGMRGRKGGSIVNISSIHSMMTQPTNLLYAGTKGAMNAAARAMALDCAADGIRVNTVCPGVVMSDVMYDETEKMDEEQKSAFIQALDRCQPLPRGQMADIANAVLFLASDMSAYITGQCILADGGTSIKAHDFHPAF